MGDSLNRRDFLKVGGAAVAVAALARCSNGASTGEFPAGDVSDFALDSVTLFDEGPFFVIRDADGLYAMSAVCAHNGCAVGVGTTELVCPCHGSVYDLDGAVVSGLAPRALEHFEVVVGGDGDVVVNTNRVVPASTRIVVA
jgi:cytochrome b6-f complex iron-sulfur subunit